MRGQVSMAGLALLIALSGCTETPDDLPECIGPGTYCPPDDAGSDANSQADAADARAPGSVDAGPDGSGADDAAGTDAGPG